VSATFTGTISGTTLTFPSATGTVMIGQALTSASVIPGTIITAGSGLSWTVNNTQTVAAEAMTGSTNIVTAVNVLIRGWTTTTPANPVPFTVRSSGGGAADLDATGLQLNLTWVTVTQLQLQPSGGVTTVGGSLAVASFLSEGEIAKPATPAAGTMRLYFKSDHHLYMLDSTGVETLVK
jgi:hypothetical protein